MPTRAGLAMRARRPHTPYHPPPADAFIRLGRARSGPRRHAPICNHDNRQPHHLPDAPASIVKPHRYRDPGPGPTIATITCTMGTLRTALACARKTGGCEFQTACCARREFTIAEFTAKPARARRPDALACMWLRLLSRQEPVTTSTQIVHCRPKLHPNQHHAPTGLASTHILQQSQRT